MKDLLENSLSVNDKNNLQNQLIFGGKSVQMNQMPQKSANSELVLYGVIIGPKNCTMSKLALIHMLLI